MPTLPTTEDVRKVGEQAVAAVGTVLEQARTPLLAALGAGDLAGKAVTEALAKARTQVNERAEAARTAVDELPSDLGGLREKLDPAELRKLLDTYTTAASNLYEYLAEHGAETLGKLRAQPQVKRALDQVEAAQHRAEDLAADARGLADDVLGKVARRTRSVGEKAAEKVEDLAEQVAEDVVEAGGEVAAETRSVTRKAANKASAPRKPATPAATAKKTTDES
ncbi:membrane protein [Kutzneria viridogrisea]|uniref:Heparin binding hemagglutinin HbhA n=1 Tax=Kutzneria viridogrisea TaxID=47990 RepID=A0ABR6BYN0_9PSEU|nr:heparin binding hemagglutinin HbhA [Kutzneria viridogrisea]